MDQSGYLQWRYHTLPAPSWIVFQTVVDLSSYGILFYWITIITHFVATFTPAHTKGWELCLSPIYISDSVLYVNLPQIIITLTQPLASPGLVLDQIDPVVNRKIQFKKSVEAFSAIAYTASVVYSYILQAGSPPPQTVMWTPGVGEPGPLFPKQSCEPLVLENHHTLSLQCITRQVTILLSNLSRREQGQLSEVAHTNQCGNFIAYTVNLQQCPSFGPQQDVLIYNTPILASDVYILRGAGTSKGKEESNNCQVSYIHEYCCSVTINLDDNHHCGCCGNVNYVM